MTGKTNLMMIDTNETPTPLPGPALPGLPDPEPAGPASAPFATLCTVEGRLIRLCRDGAGLALEMETGRGRYTATLDRFQALAFCAAVATVEG